MAIVHATTQSFEQEVLHADKPVLVDFWAAWCGPCRMLAPVLESLSDRDDFKIVKVDVDAEPALAMQFGIESIPTLLVFRNGQLVNRSIGLVSQPEILRRIDAALDEARRGGADLAFVDGAVIVGTAAQAECDRLCVVTAPFETSVARIVARDGISPEMAARRLNAQTPERTLTAQADYTLHNDAGLEALQAAAARLCERLQAEGGVTAAL